jgi:hypothetical protein
LILLFTFPGALNAQQRVVEGRVTRPDSAGKPVPVRGQWVVLHRVGSGGGAPVDSMRTNATGRYRIRYTGRPDDAEALYFVSARFSGIAYFTPPLRDARVGGGDGDIVVYETSNDANGLQWQGRHLVVSAPRGNRREIAEIFELENAGTRTIIAKDSTHPVWSLILPPRAESTAVAPGDISAASVTFRAGRAELYAPVSPGVRQVAITYLLPLDAFPISVPVERQVSVLEVLLEEPRAAVEGGKLAEVAPALIDGRQFRRFLAQDVPSNSVMRVSAPPPPSNNKNALIALGLGTALVMIMAITIRLRRHPLPARRTPQASEVDRLIAELAMLDARIERQQATPAERAKHDVQRAELRAKIERALAAESTAS